MGRRLLFWGVIVAAVVYAVQGGEFGTDDLIAMRRRIARVEAQIDSLQQEVDSLARVKKAILTDPAVQERIAREEFGMVRGDKELLYRFTTPRPDTSAAAR